jgi:hypothetical protein
LLRYRSQSLSQAATPPFEVGLKKAESVLSIGKAIQYIVAVMKNHKSLLHTNPYLSNKKLREHILLDHAAASAKIEGVKNAKKRARALAGKSSGSSSKRG